MAPLSASPANQRSPRSSERRYLIGIIIFLLMVLVYQNTMQAVITGGSFPQGRAPPIESVELGTREAKNQVPSATTAKAQSTIVGAVEVKVEDATEEQQHFAPRPPEPAGPGPAPNEDGDYVDETVVTVEPGLFPGGTAAEGAGGKKGGKGAAATNTPKIVAAAEVNSPFVSGGRLNKKGLLYAVDDFVAKEHAKQQQSTIVRDSGSGSQKRQLAMAGCSANCFGAGCWANSSGHCFKSPFTTTGLQPQGNILKCPWGPEFEATATLPTVEKSQIMNSRFMSPYNLATAMQRLQAFQYFTAKTLTPGEFYPWAKSTCSIPKLYDPAWTQEEKDAANIIRIKTEEKKRKEAQKLESNIKSGPPSSNNRSPNTAGSQPVQRGANRPRRRASPIRPKATPPPPPVEVAEEPEAANYRRPFEVQTADDGDNAEGVDDKVETTAAPKNKKKQLNPNAKGKKWSPPAGSPPYINPGLPTRAARGTPPVKGKTVRKTPTPATKEDPSAATYNSPTMANEEDQQERVVNLDNQQHHPGEGDERSFNGRGGPGHMRTRDHGTEEEKEEANPADDQQATWKPTPKPWLPTPRKTAAPLAPIETFPMGANLTNASDSSSDTSDQNTTYADGTASFKFTARHEGSDRYYRIRNFCMSPVGSMYGYQPEVTMYDGRDDVGSRVPNEVPSAEFRAWVQGTKPLQQPASCYLDTKILIMPIWTRTDNPVHVWHRVAQLNHIKETNFGKNSTNVVTAYIFTQEFALGFAPPWPSDPMYWLNQTAFNGYLRSVTPSHFPIYATRSVKAAQHEAIGREWPEATIMHPFACFKEAVVYHTCLPADCAAANRGPPPRPAYNTFGDRTPDVLLRFTQRLRECVGEEERLTPRLANPRVVLAHRTRTRRWTTSPYLQAVIAIYVEKVLNGTLIVNEMGATSTPDLVKLYGSADIVIGQYGSGLAYSVLMPPASVMIEVNLQGYYCAGSSGINTNRRCDYGGDMKAAAVHHVVASNPHTTAWEVSAQSGTHEDVGAKPILHMLESARCLRSGKHPSSCYHDPAPAQHNYVNNDLGGHLLKRLIRISTPPGLADRDRTRVKKIPRRLILDTQLVVTNNKSTNTTTRNNATTTNTTARIKIGYEDEFRLDYIQRYADRFPGLRGKEILLVAPCGHSQSLLDEIDVFLSYGIKVMVLSMPGPWEMQGLLKPNKTTVVNAATSKKEDQKKKKIKNKVTSGKLSDDTTTGSEAEEPEPKPLQSSQRKSVQQQEMLPVNFAAPLEEKHQLLLENFKRLTMLHMDRSKQHEWSAECLPPSSWPATYAGHLPSRNHKRLNSDADGHTGPYQIRNFCVRPSGPMLLFGGGSVLRFNGRDETRPVVTREEQAWDSLSKYFAQVEILNAPPPGEVHEKECIHQRKLFIVPMNLMSDSMRSVQYRMASLYDMRRHYWPDATADDVTIMFLAADLPHGDQEFPGSFHPFYENGIRFEDTFSSTVASSWFLVYGKPDHRKHLFGPNLAQVVELGIPLCFEEGMVAEFRIEEDDHPPLTLRGEGEGGAHQDQREGTGSPAIAEDEDHVPPTPQPSNRASTQQSRTAKRPLQQRSFQKQDNAAEYVEERGQLQQGHQRVDAEQAVGGGPFVGGVNTFETPGSVNQRVEAPGVSAEGIGGAVEDGGPLLTTAQDEIRAMLATKFAVRSDQILGPRFNTSSGGEVSFVILDQDSNTASAIAAMDKAAAATAAGDTAVAAALGFASISSNPPHYSVTLLQPPPDDNPADSLRSRFLKGGVKSQIVPRAEEEGEENHQKRTPRPMKKKPPALRPTAVPLPSRLQRPPPPPPSPTAWKVPQGQPDLYQDYCFIDPSASLAKAFKKRPIKFCNFDIPASSGCLGRFPLIISTDLIRPSATLQVEKFVRGELHPNPMDAPKAFKHVPLADDDKNHDLEPPQEPTPPVPATLETSMPPPTTVEPETPSPKEAVAGGRGGGGSSS